MIKKKNNINLILNNIKVDLTNYLLYIDNISKNKPELNGLDKNISRIKKDIIINSFNRNIGKIMSKKILSELSQDISANSKLVATS